METLISEVSSSLNIILGACCALLGGLFQSRISEKNRKRHIHAEKLERAYMLCQEIYDGHKREMLNAVNNLPYSPKLFLELRNHPGKETSELKMLIRCYAPELSPKLKELDKGHNPLRKDFRELEKRVASGETNFKPGIVELDQQWQSYLSQLGQGTNGIKAGIEVILNGLVK